MPRGCVPRSSGISATTADLFKAYFAALDATVGMECRALLVPRIL